jgi:hypothetical protein
MYICVYALELTNPSLWSSGSVVYASAVIIANFKILDSMHRYDFLGVVWPILSILLYFLFFYVENLPFLGIDDLLGVFSNTMLHPYTYFALLFCVIQVYALNKILDFLRDL